MIQLMSLLRNNDFLSSLDLVTIFDGDSLTIGTSYSGIEQYYPLQVQSWLNPKVNSLTFQSYGIGGQTLATMNSHVNSKIVPNVDTQKINIIFFWEDVNQILNIGTSALNTFNIAEQYASRCKVGGFDHVVIITGYYPRIKLNGEYDNESLWNAGSPTRLDNQHEYFEMIANSSGQSWDFHIDLRDDTILGGGRGQIINPAYFGDGVHLYASGYDLVAKQVEDKIVSIFK